MITFKDNILVINHNKIEFDNPIKEFLETENYIYILLDIEPKKIENKNVFCYDNKGNFIWQIDNYFKYDDCPYNFMKIDEKGFLHLYNWCGFIFKINLRDGTLIEKIFTK